MNAPATRTAVQPDSTVGDAPDLVAWGEAFMRRLADRVCVS